MDDGGCYAALLTSLMSESASADWKKRGIQ